MSAQLDLEPNKTVRSADGLRKMLRTKYPADQYAMFFEVRDGTGFQACRSADALMMSLWPSRGLEIWGFEIKVSRQDWAKELAEPAKADAIARYCDRWFLVVSDQKIVHANELPPAWGLLAPRGDGLRAIHEATKLEPAPLDRTFFAALCRAAQKQASAPSDRLVLEAVQAAKLEWKKDADTSRKREHDDSARRYEELRKTVDEFEKASGVSLSRTWEGKKIGEVVKLVRQCQLHPQVEHAAQTLRNAATSLDQLLQLDVLKQPVADVGASVDG